MKKIVILLLLLCSCASHPPVQVPGVPTYSTREYGKIFNQNTKTDEQYKGLVNTMAISVTHITPSLAKAILSKKAQIHQWDESRYNQELQDLEASLSRESHFLLTLYTPEARMDDINRKKDLWNLFLDTGMNRYIGRAERLNGTVQELAPVYPPINRFGTPYIVRFPISSSELNTRATEFLITGPVGSASVRFSH